MKKVKKYLIILTIILVISCGIGYGLYKSLVDENTLSISEKKWIDVNVSNLNTITIPNDINIFGKSGTGVFYNFSNYLTQNVGLKINNNPVSYTQETSGFRFEITNNYEKDGLLMFKDHYVLVSVNNELITNSSSVLANPVGTVNNSLEVVANYYGISTEVLVPFENYDNITEALKNGEISYAIVPLNEFKEILLANNLNINFHISDLNKYYYFRLSEGNVMLNNIMRKKFNSFMKEEYESSYNKHNYDLFVKALNLSAKDEDRLTNRNYTYGFVETKTYEVLSNGEYGGLTAEILNNFSKFSNVTFTYKKSKNAVDLSAAAINGDIDIYYNFYNIVTNFVDTGYARSIDYYVVAHNNISLNLNKLNGLRYRDVYVQENTYLYDEIKNIEGINVITYKTTEDLYKIVKKEAIIVIDKNIFDYFLTNSTVNYSIRMEGSVANKAYYFRYKNDQDPFYKLFNAYTKTIDTADILRYGVITYNKVDARRQTIRNILIGLLGVIIVLSIGLFRHHKIANRIKIDTKVKKEDKLKYIDMLTSLKNRNYYYEKLNAWNRNTIYPQACIVLDIVSVKELNDTLGHEEGDKQIKGVANILIKTQIDSSEIIRTDGNEFFIYLVGYSEKQVLSYMKKLVKEFKNLPYDYGVAMGFSMIEDDTKLIEDAFNEASIQMREHKESIKEKNVEKD